MARCSARVRGFFYLFLFWVLSGQLSVATAQQATSKAIDLDKELAADAPQNRARSYYHYALSKWFEDHGDLARALTEIRNALRYDNTSVTVRIDMANILERMGRLREAVEEAQEAARIDPRNPEPHWILANLHFRSQSRDRAARGEALRKAIAELELMREVAPDDERVYYALGGAYLEVGDTEKGIQAYEKFQDLVPGADAGYLAIARSYERASDYAKAAEYLQKALQRRPDSAETLLLLATVYSRQDKHKEAIPVYRKILELSDDNPAVKKQLGATLVDAGEFDEAFTLLEELAKNAPQDKELQILLGRAQIGRRQYDQAISVLKSVLQSNPGSLEAEFHLGSAYGQSGNPSESARIFAKLLSRTEGGSEEYKANRLVFQRHLAAAYQDMGETAKAVALYEEMAREDPGNTQLQFLLINAYRVNRQMDKAVSLGEQQLDKHPDDVNLTLVYARALADAGRTKEGAELLNRALQAHPDNTDLYVNLSQVYLQSRKFAEAERVLRRAAERKIDAERLKFQLATVYERQKEYDRAESIFKELLKENPRNATVLNYIGYMLADRGVRLQEAVRYVEQALEVEPNNGAYLDSLGWAYFKLNDLEKAEKYLLRAAEIVKNDPVIYDHLGDLYFKTGNLAKARDFWSKSVEVGTEPEEIEKVRSKFQNVQELLRRQERR